MLLQDWQYSLQTMIKKLRNTEAKMSQIDPYSVGYYNKDKKEDAAY